MDYKEEYNKAKQQIKELEQKMYDILVQAVKAKGLQVGSTFKINNIGWSKDKYYKVADEVNYYQLTKNGKIDKRISYLRFNFFVLDNVEIVED